MQSSVQFIRCYNVKSVSAEDGCWVQLRVHIAGGGCLLKPFSQIQGWCDSTSATYYIFSCTWVATKHMPQPLFAPPLTMSPSSRCLQAAYKLLGLLDWPFSAHQCCGFESPPHPSLRPTSVFLQCHAGVASSVLSYKAAGNLRYAVAGDVDRVVNSQSIYQTVS